MCPIERKMKYEQIQILLNKINLQVNDLKNAETISVLHIDMVKKNIINLYEEFLDTEDIEEDVREIKVDVAKITKDKLPEFEKEKIIVEDDTIEQKVDEKIEQKSIVDAKEKNDVQSNTMKKFDDLFGGGFFDDELLPSQCQSKQERANDVNSRYGNAQTPTIMDTIVKKVQKPLQACITIGDKFALIKDLFANNVAEYTDTIMALNEAESMNACFQIIAPIQEKYKWNDDSYAALTLLNLLKRRFS
jgi:hypothetical protein